MNSGPSWREQAERRVRLQRELKRRGLRASLPAWCIHALDGTQLLPQRHHLLLINRLEALECGDIKRLMVLMPPGSAKSTYASGLFPPWYLARNPTHAVIAASHTQSFAERWGRKVRNTIAEHSDTLGIWIAADNAAAGRWEVNRGGEYYAAGIGGTVTGRRADLVIIDDPVAKREDADSETLSEKAWEWWKSDLYTRMKPDAKVVLIMTRWSETDLGGRLLDDMATGGDQWEVLRLPMEAEANDPLGRAIGDPLWPEWFTEDTRRIAKRDTRRWSALYQQSPSPDTGDYFRREWLRPVPTLPPRESLRVFGASDYAVTDDGGDYTAHIIVGVDSDDRLYVLDLWRHQTASDQWVEAFCDLAIKWKPMGWAEETGQIRAGIGPWLDKRSRERRAFVARTAFPTRGDKSVRAQSIRGRMALSGLHVPVNLPHRADFEAELMSFPVGRHDDMVDALGLVGQLMDVMMPPGKPKPPEKPVDSWAKAFSRSGYEDGDSAYTA